MNSLPSFVFLLVDLTTWWASISVRRIRKLSMRPRHKITNTPARFSSETPAAEMVVSLLHILVGKWASFHCLMSPPSCSFTIL